MKGLFISGTTTGIGKTVASALLLMRASQIYGQVCYHKPIQTGAPIDNDAFTVFGLQPTPIKVSTGLSFKRPLSPHIAAYYENTLIDFHSVIATAKKYCAQDFTIIEGAGGLLVPINRRFLMIDLIKRLALPCVLVTNSELGTINHTLLSVEALRARNIPPYGIIMFGPKNRDNENSIRFYGKVDNLLALPKIPHLNRDSLRALVLDHQQKLDQFLAGVLYA